MSKKILCYEDDENGCEEILTINEVDEADVDFDDYPYWEEDDFDDAIDEQTLEDMETERRFQAKEARKFFEDVIGGLHGKL